MSKKSKTFKMEKLVRVEIYDPRGNARPLTPGKKVFLAEFRDFCEKKRIRPESEITNEPGYYVALYSTDVAHEIKHWLLSKDLKQIG